MREVAITESKDSAPIDLEAEEVAALRQLGQAFASRSSWWGRVDENVSDATAVRCLPAPGGKWTLRVDNAVGVIATEDLQISITPKIPSAHLLYLFEESQALPRSEEYRALVESDEPLWKLVVMWFLTATERVLRRGLVRDYLGTREETAVIRGRIHGQRTATNYYRGRLLADCEFDEFEFDTPLNRVLLSGARVIAGSPVLDPLLRNRGRHIVGYLDDVAGEIRPTDFDAVVERRTQHYGEAIAMARHVIRRTGRSLSHGEGSSWSFLIPTPNMVEEGIRRIIRAAIDSVVSVEKRGKQLSGSMLTVNPDLVFGPSLGVGDVKYKLSGGSWNRADLYEVIAFAAAFRTRSATVVTFSLSEEPEIAPTIRIGDFEVSQMVWPASSGLHPRVARDRLGAQALAWASTLVRGESSGLRSPSDTRRTDEPPSRALLATAPSPR